MIYYPKKASVLVYALTQKTHIITATLNVGVLTEQFAYWHHWPVGHILISTAIMGTELMKMIWIAHTKDICEKKYLWKQIIDK